VPPHATPSEAEDAYSSNERDKTESRTRQPIAELDAASCLGDVAQGAVGSVEGLGKGGRGGVPYVGVVERGQMSLLGAEVCETCPQQGIFSKKRRTLCFTWASFYMCCAAEGGRCLFDALQSVKHVKRDVYITKRNVFVWFARALLHVLG